MHLRIKNTPMRDITGKSYLAVSKTDLYTVSELKYTITGEPNNDILIEKLTKIIGTFDNEVLRVRIDLLSDANSNYSLHEIDIAKYRAKRIVESINGDGVYFIYLVAAVNFLEARRHYNCGNEYNLREKYLEDAMTTCGNKTVQKWLE